MCLLLRYAYITRATAFYRRLRIPISVEPSISLAMYCLLLNSILRSILLSMIFNENPDMYCHVSHLMEQISPLSHRDVEDAVLGIVKKAKRRGGS